MPELSPGTEQEGRKRIANLDLGLVVGAAIALCAIIIGILSTGLDIRLFLHPTGAAIVLGGTLGVTVLTAPPKVLAASAKRLYELFSPVSVDREALVEEIVACARVARRGGILAMEPLAQASRNSFLRSALLLALDVKDRAELQSALEMHLRVRERQGETDARTFEVAGGFAPTIGILGTVVGLIQVLHQFSNMQAVGLGIGTAFVSTIYGLGLANLLLLPIAHRIRARMAEAFEVEEMTIEGVLYLADRVHPSLIRLKLGSFLPEQKAVAAHERRPEARIASAGND